MEIELELLAHLNSGAHLNGIKLAPKFLAKVTASSLASLLLYDKTDNKKQPFRIKPISTIQVDVDIQRGPGDHLAKTLAQEASKVREIADGLLSNKKGHQIFLGTLVWNVRTTQGGFKTPKLDFGPTEPVKRKLVFETDKIFLTDSAHRHFGIIEALNRYKETPEKFADGRFNEELEFAVEIYNLDANTERMLFQELNDKQKKITSARRKHVDISTPSGAMKNAIQTVDLGDQQLFYENIEATTNLNTRHTLMTMSVFVNSIVDMFGNPLLKQAAEDEGTMAELAEYYCLYFYALNDNIRIRYGTSSIEVNPFENLYNAHIKEAAESEVKDEEKYSVGLQNAVKKATEIAQAIRREDKTNSNPVIRALSCIGGEIRFMPDWREVIIKLQTDCIASADYRFFQVSNDDLFESARAKYGTEMGIKTENGLLNIQVQGHVIKALANYLMDKLDLRRSPQAAILKNTDLLVLDEIDPFYTWSLSKSHENELEIDFSFFVSMGLTFQHSDLLLNMVPTEKVWPKGKLKKRIEATDVLRDDSYEDKSHPTNIEKYTCSFRIKVPAYDGTEPGNFKLELSIAYPKLNGEITKAKFCLLGQPEDDA